MAHWIVLPPLATSSICFLQIIDFLEVYQATNNLAIAGTNLTSFNQVFTWPSSAEGCESDGPNSDTSYSVDGGLGRDDVILTVDNEFFSYAGCRCSAGYDNIYDFDGTGRFAHLL